MLDFSHIPNAANGAETFIFNALGANDWQTWVKPRGKSLVNIIAISPGGGGGNGFSAAAATARGGGGGGGSGAISRFFNIPLITLPDTLFINVALGGAPGAAASGVTLVSVRPDSTTQNRVASAATAAAAAGGNGSAVAVGAAGLGATIISLAPTMASLGTFSSVAGQQGSAGGAVAGGVGTAVTWGNLTLPLCGGAGGGGTTSVDFAGAAINAGGWFPSLAGGLAASRGQDGFYSAVPFGACGGSGGGSSNAATGGAGGDGAIGCGGGGGGAGVTGGAGGKGGHGLVIINCW
jgi:hypothetical protein